ncbi:MAG TPA: peptide-methionine (S)-S-oxide reductase [Candidatus Paceibacterota bacterium]
MEKVAFGGGCFWCTEAVFKMLKGVEKVFPGYAGSPKAEVAYIEYEKDMVSFRDLLTVFFATHDPTILNRQGNDIGPEYRSVIFFTTPEQEAEAGRYIKSIPGAVTELALLDKFIEAENYHRNYYEMHKDTPYCQIIINPKLEKVQKKFGELLLKK